MLVPPNATPGRFVRVEFLGFQSAGEHREFRFRVSRPDDQAELCVRIAIAAFSSSRVRLQDGPDVCYQKLLQAVAAGQALIAETITLDEADLTSYREAHTPAQKHRSWTPPVRPESETTAPLAVAPRPRAPQPPPAPPAAKSSKPEFGEGHRVSHAVFGVGVTSASADGHTTVHFDQDGSKTFVTSMLEMEVLSDSHTWETSARGVNRPCATGTRRS